jgi:hypothetical protein
MAVITGVDALRPGFSLVMELLCSLPRWPAQAPLTAIVRDLNLPNQVLLQKMLRDLKGIGFDVRCTNHDRYGRVAYITRLGWEYAEAAAENYWQTIWGDKRGTAPDLGGEAAAPSAAA